MTGITNNTETLTLLRLIKLFIQLNPFCTSRDIVSFFSSERYGIQTQYDAKSIGRLIKGYSNTSSDKYWWFDIEIIENKSAGNRYYCKLSGDVE